METKQYCWFSVMRSVDLNLKLEIVDKPVVLLTAPGYTHTPSRSSGNTRPKTILTTTNTGGPTKPNPTDPILTITDTEEGILPAGDVAN